MPDTKIDIAELRRLLEKATRGPWEQSARNEILGAVDGDGEDVVIGALGVSSGFRSHAYTVCKREAPDNAALVLAAVNALPSLLDQLEQTQREVERLTYSAFVDGRGNELRCSQAVYQEVGRLRDEIEQTRFLVTGGEDAPGHVMSLPFSAIQRVADDNLSSWHAEVERAEASQARVAELTAEVEAVTKDRDGWERIAKERDASGVEEFDRAEGP